jgi:hypothetical protein
MSITSRKGKRVPVSASAHRAEPDVGESSTRTSSRSAKRRSPKEPPEDPALLEVERVEFLRAMDRYKRKTGKTFPSWTEVLDVLRSIGWTSPARVESNKSTPI